MTANGEGKAGKRGHYEKYTAKEKATIANYAMLHGSSSAVRHFKKDYPGLKRTTVTDWRDTIVRQRQHNRREGIEKPIVELECKQKGRPSLLSPELTEELKLFMYSNCVGWVAQ